LSIIELVDSICTDSVDASYTYYAPGSKKIVPHNVIKESNLTAHKKGL